MDVGGGVSVKGDGNDSDGWDEWGDEEVWSIAVVRHEVILGCRHAQHRLDLRRRLTHA